MRARTRLRGMTGSALLVLCGWLGAVACDGGASDGSGGAGAGDGGGDGNAAHGGDGTDTPTNAGAAGQESGGSANAAGASPQMGGQPPTPEGGAGSWSNAGEGGSAGDAGVGGVSPVGDASGGAGGANNAGAGGDANASCVRRPLVGDYRLQAHNEVRTCFKDDFTCAPPDLVEDHSVTFHLFQLRDDPTFLAGSFDGPGITLGPSWAGGQGELWDPSLLVYYPDPGDNVDIMNDLTPIEKTGPWDPSRAKGWVRVIADTCFTDYDVGWVHIDIDLATGRVIDFARKCNEELMTIWYEYRLRGEGQLLCEADACNEVVNDAPTVEPEIVAQAVPMTQGEVHGGRYHLKAIEYQWDVSCFGPEPSAAAETLEVDAYGIANGSMSLAREVVGGSAIHSTFYYYDYGGNALGVSNVCGEEALAPDFGSLSYSASENELRLRVGLVCEQSRFVDYVYEKQ